MIHFSCDRCKRMIDPAREMHHVVKIETQTPIGPLESSELEEDRDYLMEIDEMLDAIDLDDEALLDDMPREFRFDLCPACYRKYLRDPLGAESLARVGFSHN